MELHMGGGDGASSGGHVATLRARMKWAGLQLWVPALRGIIRLVLGARVVFRVITLMLLVKTFLLVSMGEDRYRARLSSATAPGIAQRIGLAIMDLDPVTLRMAQTVGWLRRSLARRRVAALTSQDETPPFPPSPRLEAALPETRVRRRALPQIGRSAGCRQSATRVSCPSAVPPGPKFLRPPPRQGSP